MAHRDFEINQAKTAGFCMGVRRAVRMVLEAAEDPRTSLPILTPGPLIHNRQVLEVLQKRGVLELGEEGETSGPGGTAVVRAHGLSRERQEELLDKVGELLDATCPHVRRVQEIVAEHARMGYLCVVVGDAGHAEVEGVLSYAEGRGRVVAGPQEVDALPEADKVVVVAQTTQNEAVFRSTVEKVRERYGDCLSFETICRSTGRRQQEVRELARRVEAMIVVGGHNSANTRRLAEISESAGVPTYYVETEHELDVDAVLEYGKVGLTAGASTPNWMIRRVVLRLQDEHRRRTHPLWALVRTVSRAVVYTNLYAAGALAALTYTAAHLYRAAPGRIFLCMAVSFFYVLAQQILNQYARRRSLYLSEPARSDFFMSNERALLWLGMGSGLLSLFLAYLIGPWAFGLVVLGSAGGLAYRLKLPGSLVEGLGLRSLEQVPASKEVFVGLAWATLAALVPALAVEEAAGVWRPALLAFGVCFLMAFQRTLALDLRDVEADQLMGRETLATLLGPGGASRLFIGIGLAEVLLLVAGASGGWAASLAYWLPVVALYSLVAFRLLRSPDGVQEELCEVLVDGQFYLAAVLAAGWAVWG
ncbi:MAG: 4-hydroxy-3-methylbut-2-enyl diphosphate reductase [Candidatus Brocadiia bacterium]